MIKALENVCLTATFFPLAVYNLIFINDTFAGFVFKKGLEKGSVDDKPYDQKGYEGDFVIDADELIKDGWICANQIKCLLHKCYFEALHINKWL